MRNSIRIFRKDIPNFLAGKVSGSIPFLLSFLSAHAEAGVRGKVGAGAVSKGTSS
jgi:hypothetical protein